MKDERKTQRGEDETSIGVVMSTEGASGVELLPPRGFQLAIDWSLRLKRKQYHRFLTQRSLQ